jgi:rhodanese-related sulfurtransferase
VETKALAAGLTLATLADVQVMVRDQTHLLLDARPVSDYDRGHLPGAFSLPQTDLDTYYPQIMPLLTREPAPAGLLLRQGMRRILPAQPLPARTGHTNVALFVGGYLTWQAARPKRRGHERGAETALRDGWSAGSWAWFSPPPPCPKSRSRRTSRWPSIAIN